MLANERFIVKMSLEQKVKFVTSVHRYESSTVDKYEFPVFKLKSDPYKDCPSVRATCFPSDRALACTWNSRLIREVYRAAGEETRRVHSFGYFNNTTDYTLEEISSDYFYTAKFILERTLGLSVSGQAVNLEKTFDKADAQSFDEVFLFDTVLTDGKPTSVLIENPDDVESIRKKYKYHNAFFGRAASAEGAVRLLLAGCSLVFLDEEQLPALVNFMTERTEGYRKAYQSYRNGSLPLGEFDRRVRSLEIFDEGILDEACDTLLTILFSMKDGGENIPPMTGLDKKRPAKFDEAAHDALALRAARESAVLVKNDGILPLDHHTRLAVAGEYANDFSYQKELFGICPTVKSLPFDAIYDYEELATTGFVTGYAKGERGRADLIDSALELAGRSDCVLLYLCAGRGQTMLPPEQIELLDALHEKGVGVVAVVACYEQIDVAFTDKCRAVLLTYCGGQEGTTAVLDILTGAISPSGKLAEEAIRRNGDVKFPFGYGLSYTTFDYRQLKVSEKGVSLTIANTGRCDGFASVQLYVKKADSDGPFAERALRGFAKAFVKKGDAVNVAIPFDENTFKSYSEDKKCFVIEGGEYEITISESAADDKLTGKITLRGHTYKETFENEVVESSDGAEIPFTGVNEHNAAVRAGKKLSFSVKLVVALLLGIYFNAVLALFAFTDLIPDKEEYVYYILGGLAGVIEIVLLVYIIVISKKRKKQKLLPVNEVLTDLVQKVGDFKEIAKETYLEPVKEEEETEEKPDGEEEEDLSAPLPEETERTYDVSFDEETEDVTFVEHVSLPELCLNFREYALSFGVNIEMTSVRALLSAVAASKIVILRAANTEAMPDFLEALVSYFGSAAVTEAHPDWSGINDLLWREGEDRYVVSDFTNAVHGAVKTPAKMCAAVLTNVDFDKLSSYFGKFVEYALRPSELHELKLNDELTLKLPNNITYFLVPGEGTKNISRELANAATCIDLALSKADRGEEVEIKNVALGEFNDLVKTSREEAFLPEVIWKKTDELVGVVKSTERFEIGNKNTLQIERLTSVIIECGGDEAEAFTQMFVSKLIPLLKTTRLYRQDGGERTLSGIIEKLFPEEELTKIQKALVKLN